MDMRSIYYEQEDRSHAGRQVDFIGFTVRRFRRSRLWRGVRWCEHSL